MKNRRLRILHIVCHFCAGGCERLLSDVLRHSDRSRYSHSVISLSDNNERIGDIKKTLNIPYFALDMKREPQLLPKLVRDCRPDIIKTWLPQSNVTGALVGKVFGVPVIWGLHSAMPPEQFPSEMPLIEKQLRQAHLPERIVCCSRPAYDLHVRLGFAPDRMVIIDNGVDTERFTHCPAGRRRIRKSLGIGDDAPLIGMAAVYISSIKGHAAFLRAAKLLLASHPDAHFLLCGRDTGAGNKALASAVARLGLKKRVHLLGIRDDMADIYSALDIHTLNSKSESFGLATAEAMACKTLCVMTDVGVAQALLQDVGIVIPPLSTPGELARAWQSLLMLPPEEKTRRRKKGRERIRKDYSISETARRYDELYREHARGALRLAG